MRRFSRRDFLKIAGGLAFAATVPFPRPSVSGMLGRIFGSQASETLPITPNDEFYITSYRSPPDVRLHKWALSIKGLVERPMVLTYSEVLARPSVSEIVTLECIGNGVAGEAISTAKWEGIPLKTLLQEAGVSPRGDDVIFRAADGYSDSIPMERAMKGDVLVTHTMNGVTLPRGHGFPVRMIVPGIYGMKSVQWLTDIEVVDHDYKGYYEKKGWSDDASVKTMSRIDRPVYGDTIQGLEYTMKGIAFAGTRGVALVEVSMDGGATWQAANLEPPLSPYAWVFWSYRWKIRAAGDYSIMVRATDGAGQLQTSFEQVPYPEGATGLDEIGVTVES